MYCRETEICVSREGQCSATHVTSGSAVKVALPCTDAADNHNQIMSPFALPGGGGGGELGLHDRIDGSMKEGRCVCVCLSEDFLLTLSSYDREN